MQGIYNLICIKKKKGKRKNKMKIFKWQAKFGYSSAKYNLDANTEYEIGKDITEEDANRIKNDFPDLVKIYNKSDNADNAEKKNDDEPKKPIIVENKKK
jgi:hypothetical protein